MRNSPESKMTVELDFRTVAYLWSFWLKEVPTNDCQLTGEILLAILGWLTEPRIENLVKCEALSLFSSSMNRLRSGEIINKCAPLLFGERRSENEWFSLPPSGKREQAVNVIYVNRAGRSNRIYATQYGDENFLDLPQNSEWEIFFHGTDQSSAEKITNGGIDVEIGGEKKDFSDGGGFYLARKLKDVLDVRWAHGRGRCCAVLVFKAKRAELRGVRNGLYLNGESKPKWKKVIKNFRKGLRDRKLKKELEPYDFLEGALAGGSQSYDNPFPNPNSYQLCVRTNVCARLFNESLHSVMFFESVH